MAEAEHSSRDAEDAAARRQRFETKAASLIGSTILEASYWDIHNFGPEPRTWDYGDWHHAVMGVEFLTGSGPVTVVWTDAFFPYGVEVFPEPISEHLLLRPEGSEGWRVESQREWVARAGEPVLAASFHWETIEVGPAVQATDGVQVADARTFSVPVALRLDFKSGPVWMVAGIPQLPDIDKVFVPGDEVMVVFSEDRMRRIGFPESGFIRSRA
jgi:hypothetical protein